MNKTTLIGRLTKDVDLRYTQSGSPVAGFTLAIDRRSNKEGQKEADFIPIVVWGKSAESAAKYLSKGKLVGIAGRIQTRSYDAQDGGKRYITEVVAEEVQYLDWGNNSKQEDDDFQPVDPVDDGDIPF